MKLDYQVIFSPAPSGTVQVACLSILLMIALLLVPANDSFGSEAEDSSASVDVPGVQETARRISPEDLRRSSITASEAAKSKRERLVAYQVGYSYSPKAVQEALSTYGECAKSGAHDERRQMSPADLRQVLQRACEAERLALEKSMPFGAVLREIDRRISDQLLEVSGDPQPGLVMIVDDGP